VIDKKIKKADVLFLETEKRKRIKTRVDKPS
jgi:hypothetical protein